MYSTSKMVSLCIIGSTVLNVLKASEVLHFSFFLTKYLLLILSVITTRGTKSLNVYW